MKKLPLDIDIHTHAGAPRPGVIVNVDPVDTAVLPDGNGPISVGIHPWNADRADEAAFARLEAFVADNRVVAIGEAGLDRARGPEISVQLPVFERQAVLADRLGLPLVIHGVRANDLLLGLRKRLRPANQWILHGFRGNAAAAAQLLAADIDLSYGHSFNPAAYAVTPPDRRYRETDA